MSQSIIPIPRAAVSVRVATIEDLAFIDGLQKQHRKQLGFLPTAAVVGKIEKGEVLVAEECLTADGTDITDKELNSNASVSSVKSVVQSVGYIMGTDRYHKHDDVGIIYQLNVVPGRQRGFVGATLLKAMFDRAAYGCKLFCCWCAQDIAANQFWEAMGFVPMAFRAGSEKKRRTHIFWQKRIRESDTTTPWWFPSETTGGSMAAARLALPIPPGVRWSDEMPIFLPDDAAEAKQIESQVKTPRPTVARDNKPAGPKMMLTTAAVGMCFTSIEPPKPEIAEKPKRSCAAGAASAARKRAPKKNDAKLVGAARELRDRWLEHVNAGGAELVSQSKYDLVRALPGPVAAKPLLLPAA
jgi:hypothetical protein